MRHPVRPMLAGLLLPALLLSCQTDPAPTAGADADFFPLEPGHYVIYNVVEERYSLTAAPTTQTYQLREEITEPYTDVVGQPAFRIRRSRRSADGQPWQPDSVWTARRTSSEAIRTENGADYLKLVFPVDDGLRWNGNVYNAFGHDPYEIRNSRQPFSVLGKTFAETVTVQQQNDSTLVSQDRRVEVYARQVGLIYKETVRLQFCSNTPACVGRAQIDFGLRQTYQLRSHGKN